MFTSEAGDGSGMEQSRALGWRGWGEGVLRRHLEFLVPMMESPAQQGTEDRRPSLTSLGPTVICGCQELGVCGGLWAKGTRSEMGVCVAALKGIRVSEENVVGEIRGKLRTRESWRVRGGDKEGVEEMGHQRSGGKQGGQGSCAEG